MTLREKLAAVGRRIGEREAEYAPGLADSRAQAEKLHAAVADGLEGFHAAVSDAGADHLVVQLGTPHVDDKHVRSVEFDLRRGRTRAIVTVKARGEVTLVGPFKAGKNEGPCRSFPAQAESEIAQALGEFLERFLEEAATP